MRRMVWLCVLSLALASGLPSNVGADQNWVGIISDSMCTSDHGGEVDPRECTAKCVKAGDKYVLMTDGGVTAVPIANQDFPDLAPHAGGSVKVSGELKDGAIVVTRIEAAR
jgi:hypothetical protein